MQIATCAPDTPDAFVIYFMHVLQNYTWKTPEQTATAAALRSAGVDLVIGCGAHRMQEVEFDGKQWTFYGLGNFVFNAAGAIQHLMRRLTVLLL